MNGYILGAALGVTLLVSAVGYFFYKKNEKLKAELLATNVQVQSYEKRMTDLATSINDAQKTMNDLSRKNNEIEKAADKRKEDLDKILRTHDIDKIAARKASLLTRRVNSASDRVMKTFELLTNPNYVYTTPIDFGASSLEKNEPK